MALADLQPRLAALVEEHDVAGAAVGVLHQGDVTTAAAGFANRHAGVEATPDTVFQIGSQGKMWTATVLMQLVDEGLVDVDATVRTYLPDFAVADPQRRRDRDAAPPAVAHERDRRRQLRRLRPRRRLPRALRRLVRRARADPPARRHDVVLQHRLLDPRPGDRGGHRQGVGRRDARAAVRSARAHPHRHAARGGAAPSRRGRARRAVARRGAGGRPGVDAAPRLWPDGADQLDRRRRPRRSPGSTSTPARVRDGNQLVSAERIGVDAASRRSRAPTVTRSARTGDSA